MWRGTHNKMNEINIEQSQREDVEYSFEINKFTLKRKKKTHIWNTVF